MNIKCLIAASVAAVVSVSAAQAQSSQGSGSQVQGFSWAGFYIGIQGGMPFGEIKPVKPKAEKPGGTETDKGGTGKSITPENLSYRFKTLEKEGEDTQAAAKKDADLRKLSGFVGGLYAGYYMDLNGVFLLGFDTDIALSNQKNTKEGKPLEITSDNKGEQKKKLEAAGVKFPEKEELKDKDKVFKNLVIEENWVGATRVQLGISLGRMIPYVAGGVSYAQVTEKEVYEVKRTEKANEKDVTKTVVSGGPKGKSSVKIGYTAGGGLAFAMTDSIVARAEYRFTDFGKSKFLKDEAATEGTDHSFQSHDFRVGVAYKF